MSKPEYVIPADPTKAIDWMLAHAHEYAEAKSNVARIEDFMKSKRAMLQKASGAKTVSERECDALANPEYLELIDGYAAAVYQATLLQTLIKAAELRVDWARSMEATNRRTDRVTA